MSLEPKEEECKIDTRCLNKFILLAVVTAVTASVEVAVLPVVPTGVVDALEVVLTPPVVPTGVPVVVAALEIVVVMLPVVPTGVVVALEVVVLMLPVVIELPEIVDGVLEVVVLVLPVVPGKCGVKYCSFQIIYLLCQWSHGARREVPLEYQ